MWLVGVFVLHIGHFRNFSQVTYLHGNVHRRNTMGTVYWHFNSLLHQGSHFSDFYRPQTKFAKVMFLHLSVSHSVYRGRGVSRPRPRGVCPGGVSRPRPGCVCVCVSQHALRQTPPLPPADGYCCRRYASYWNAFLFSMAAHYRRPLTRRCP